MQFADVVGQQRLKSLCVNIVARGRVPHAILISGARGTGVLPFAWAFTQYLMCEQPQNGDSCGQCAACYKVHTLQHADVKWCFPVVPKKSGDSPMSEDFYAEFRTAINANPYISPNAWANSIDTENKQPNITARECRHLVQALSNSAVDGNKKILLMWQPEALGNEGNILLKMIEEPPANTIIILATEDPSKILATIQSRTQLMQLDLLQQSQIADALQQKYDASVEQAMVFARLSEGSFTEAVELIQHGETTELQHQHFALLKLMFNAVFSHKGDVMVHFCDALAELSRNQQKQFVHYCILILEHYVRYQNGLTEELYLKQDEAEVVKKLGALQMDMVSVELWQQELSSLLQALELNINAKVVGMATLLKLSRALRGLPI